MSEIWQPMFSPRIFMVSWLTFKSFIHCEVFLVYSISSWSSFLFLHVPVQFSRDHLYPIVWSCLPCQILIDHKNMDWGPGWCGSVDWVLACKPKGYQLDSQSGHMPGFRARLPVGDMQETTTYWCFFPSLSPSLPFSLKEINKFFFKKWVDFWALCSVPLIFNTQVWETSLDQACSTKSGFDTHLVS